MKYQQHTLKSFEQQTGWDNEILYSIMFILFPELIVKLFPE